MTIKSLRDYIVGFKGATGNAQVGDVRQGKTFSNEDNIDLTGTIPVQATAAQNVTPGTSDIIKPAGIYDGPITVKGDPNLIPENILAGKSIFGVLGSLEPGKKWASGTALVNDGVTNFGYYNYARGYTTLHYVTIPPLNFIPSFVIVFADLSKSFNGTVYRKITENQGIAQFFQASDYYLSTTNYSIDYTISTGGADLPFQPSGINVNWFAVE